MKRTLTDKFVRSLPAAGTGKRAEHWDAALPGFGVRVTDRGAKSYVVYTRWPGTGQPARRALGDATRLPLAVARKRARAWLDLVEQGIDPKDQERDRALEEQRRRLTTFAAVAKDWLSEAVIGPDPKRPIQRKGPEVERDVRREFIAGWGKRPITSITTLDVRTVIRAKASAAPAQARNLLGYAKRLFGWAVAQHAYGITESPAERLRPNDIIGKKVIRQRVLTDPELRALWRAAEGMAYPYGPLFRMLALTGQRKSEVAEARWREFDLQKKLWIIPAERMKIDAAHVVPLTDDVIAILESLPKFKKGDYLFSTMFGVKPVNGFSKLKSRLDRAMRAELGGDPEHWTIHDIRRTMRTGLSALPIPDRVRELVIAHAQPGLHKVYDQHAYIDEKRRALELWAARLRAIVTPTAAHNVVHLHAAGG
jgi:integrase